MQAMDTKKISFGFSKVAKKPNILPSKVAKEENRVELIKCVEGKEIKLIAERTEAAPLVIQMQGSQKTSSALASLMKRRQVLLGEDEPDPDESTSAPQSIAEVTAAISAENLEQRAARELLADAQANGSENLNGEKLVLPAVKADELPLEGAKEASLDDYESIPIQQFGLAMLRGMGWVEPPPKKKGSGPVDEAPFLRPKGMGLGADKALKPKALLVQPEKNEVLEIKKQAFVRILGGKQKDQYGQIEGFDDHAGRVIVKMAIGGNKEAFNEFLCQPVSRKEYSQYGKCINSAKYNEFKKQENEHGQIIVKQEKPSEGRSRDRREESKSYRNEDRDRKSYKGEGDQRSFKDKDRRSYKDEDRKSWKSESRNDRNDRSEKVESKPIKGDDRRHHKLDDHGDRKKYIQDPRSSSSSAHRTSTMQHQREERERRRSTSPRSSRRQKSSSDEADDTGESTESDSDSAYERKKPKKKATKKSKKHSKKSKSKSSRANDSSAESDDSLDEHRRHPTKHKKKTKKSKHARSRSRSRSRGRGK